MDQSQALLPEPLAFLGEVKYSTWPHEMRYEMVDSEQIPRGQSRVPVYRLCTVPTSVHFALPFVTFIYLLIYLLPTVYFSLFSRRCRRTAPLLHGPESEPYVGNLNGMVPPFYCNNFWPNIGSSLTPRMGFGQVHGSPKSLHACSQNFVLGTSDIKPSSHPSCCY
jgi:hypothetical protein